MILTVWLLIESRNYPIPIVVDGLGVEFVNAALFHPLSVGRQLREPIILLLLLLKVITRAHIKAVRAYSWGLICIVT